MKFDFSFAIVNTTYVPIYKIISIALYLHKFSFHTYGKAQEVPQTVCHFYPLPAKCGYFIYSYRPELSGLKYFYITHIFLKFIFYNGLCLWQRRFFLNSLLCSFKNP